MSFSRIHYDDNAYQLKMARSVAPGDYRLYNGFNENCDKCFSYDGPKNSKADISEIDSNNKWGGLAEVESLLTNRKNKLTDGNENQKNDSYKNFPVKNPDNCDNTLVPEDTRFTYPIEAFRCMDLTDFHFNPYLSTNPQCEIQDDRIGSNSRLSIKDRHVAKIPKLADQSVFLPPSSNNNVNISDVVNNQNQNNFASSFCKN
jgi:hypothetical protein